MICKICGNECAEGEKICKNCGCDLPLVAVQSKISQENKTFQQNLRNSSGMTAIDISRNRLIEGQRRSERMLWIIRILLVAALIFYILFPVVKLTASSTTSKLIDGMNELLSAFGAEEEEMLSEELGPFKLTGFDLITSKTFETDYGDIDFGMNFYILISALLVAATLAISFVPDRFTLKDTVMSITGIGAFLAAGYAGFDLMTSPNSSYVSNLQYGYYLLIAVIFASALCSSLYKLFFSNN